VTKKELRHSPGRGRKGSPRQQDATAFGRGGMRHCVAGMSPHMGVGQRTTALPVGLHGEEKEDEI